MRDTSNSITIVPSKPVPEAYYDTLTIIRYDTSFGDFYDFESCIPPISIALNLKPF